MEEEWSWARLMRTRSAHQVPEYPSRDDDFPFLEMANNKYEDVGSR